MHRLAILCLTLAACDDGGLVELEVVEPSATVELLPGGETELAWIVIGGVAELVVTLIPLNQPAGLVIFDEEVAEGAGSFVWTGRDVDGALVPPDVYDLDFALFVDGEPVDGALRNLSVHGVLVTDPGPGETRVILGSAGETDVHYVTVSQRVIMMTTLLDDIPIDERSIPGEFVPFERTVHFDGLDLDGAAIPAGQYTLTVHAWDADAPELDYTSTGGTVDWQPLNVGYSPTRSLRSRSTALARTRFDHDGW